MSQYITELNVSTNEIDELLLQNLGFSKIYVDLNKGAGGKFIYLWYKKGQDAPITRIQFSFNDEMSQGLKAAGYEKINKQLNFGTNGDPIYMWFYRGCTKYDVPIVDLQVTADPEVEPQQFRLGWEKLTCNLNRNAGGNWTHLWVKREKPTYICDVVVTVGFEADSSYFQVGYIRMDEDFIINTQKIFIWYRQTTDPQQGLADLKISTSKEENYENQQYQKVSVNLSEKSGRDPVYLWYRKDDSSDSGLRALSVLTNKAAVQVFDSAGVHVLKYDLNMFNDGPAKYLCLYL